MQADIRWKPFVFFSGFLTLVLSGIVCFYGSEPAFLWVNQNLTPPLGQAARGFSFLGESFSMGILLILSFWKEVRKTILIALVWLIGACYSWIFKLWIFKGLARPFEYFGKKHVTIQLVEGVKVLHFNSFPSGHTLTAFSAAFLAIHLFPKIAFRYQGVLVICATLCGLSRVVLAQHWLLDVAGGIFLGTLAFFTGRFLLSPLKNNPSLDKPLIELIRNKKD